MRVSFMSKKSSNYHYFIEPPQGFVGFGFAELWQSRELILSLAMRDIRVRYKQTALGIFWAILQPAFAMVIFTVVFGYFAGMSSEGYPYPVFAYCALLPWQLFSQSLSGAGSSLITNRELLTKIYFPRLVIPLSQVFAGVVDFFVALPVLIILMLIYDIEPSLTILTLPILVLFTILVALSVGVWVSAWSVRYRDFQHLLPFLTMCWLYATPIVYSTNLVPENWRLLYSLNPMVGVIDSFRWALLGSGGFNGQSMLVSIIVVLLLLASGILFFRKMESTFADII